MRFPRSGELTRLLKWLPFALLALAVACGGGGGDGLSPSASATATASPLLTARPTATATPEPTDLPSPPPTPTPAPTATPGSAPATVVRLGNASRMAVAFTFDAGSDAGYTAQILDTLKANGITAAFGVTGKWAEQNPGLLTRIAADGHVFINHSYDHPSFTGNSTGRAALTQVERWDQLDRTEAVVQQVAGATTKPYFRPPYGDYDDSVNVDVGARGYAYNVMWTVDSYGWKEIPAAEITQRCLDLAEPGAIYIFHVGSASQDGPALQDAIDGLRAAGYAILPLPDVLAQ